MLHTVLARQIPLRVFLSALVALPFTSVGQLYQPEITESVLANRTINISKPVGVVEGSASVTSTGGAAYAIPIYVPPGTNGVQPTLTVSYNSQCGDGVLGWGWNLGGLSAITRTGTDWYHDSNVCGITYTGGDRFAIDGQRLVLTSSGDYGGTGTTYDTENASFAVYTVNGTVNNGISSFTVISKSGMYMEYGATEDSRIPGDGGNSTYTWRLNKMRDPNGNYIKYSYQIVDGESLLTQIDYTGNDLAGIIPYNKIVLSYEPRTDKNEVFVHGPTSIRTANVLSRIRVYCEGSVMKVYRFNYSIRDIDKTYLREVGEYAADGQTGYNTTVIQYPLSNTSDLSTESAEGIVEPIGRDYFSGDYDGNGDSELMTSSYYELGEGGFQYNTDLKIYDRVGPSQYELRWSMDLAGADAQVVNEQVVPQTYSANVSNDMSGDGRDDIVLSTVHFDGTHYKLQHISVLESASIDSTVFSPATYPAPYWTPYPGAVPPTTYDVVYPNTFSYKVTGDFNGDGKCELVVVLGNINSYQTFEYSPWAGYTGEAVFFLLGVGQGNASTILAKSSRLLSIDFDGDGAQEVLSIPSAFSVDQKARVFKWSNSPYPAFWMIKEFGSGEFPTSQDDLYPGDFNGDGKVDFLTKNPASSVWYVNYSNGSGFTSQVFPDLFGPLPSGSENLNISDLNGDGRSDVSSLQYFGGGQSVIIRIYSQGYSFFATSALHPGVLGWSRSIALDLNGDGRSEVLNAESIFSFSAQGHERSISKIANGTGAVTEFQYGFMTDPALHTRGVAFGYPHGDAQLPLELVKLVNAPNGLGGINPVAYSYGGACLNRTGRGFVGFKQLTSADPIANSIAIQQNIIQPDYSELIPQSAAIYRFDDPTQLLSHTVQSYAHEPLGLPSLRRHLTKLLSTTDANLLAGTLNSNLNLSWDSYNNVTSSSSNVNSIETTSTVTNYIASGPSSALSKPQYVTVTKTRGTEPSITKKTKFIYEPVTGQVQRSIDFYGTEGAVTTTYEYETPGNIKTKTTEFPLLNADQRPLEKFRYESKFRFVERHTLVWNDYGNLVNVTEQIVTDPKWGTPLSGLSSDGLTTIMSYDDFGRLLETWVPHIAGTPRYSLTQARDWAVDGGLQYFSTTTTDPSGPDQTVFYDLLGRPIKTIIESFGHTNTSSEITYDGRGNIWHQTTPHMPGEDFLTLEHTFDPFNRKRQDIHPLSGSVDYSYEYNGGLLTTTVTNESTGQWSSSTVDATGQTVQAQDDGGKLKYEYDSWGNLLKVWHDGLQVARNRYDEYGRQTELYAPNAGTTYYKYNPFGQLMWQKDANANEVSFKYDNLGRESKRTGPEGETKRTYFNVGNRINNNLTLVDGPTVDRAYAYNDVYNRLSSSTSTIAGQAYVTAYQYNDYDQLVTQTYPSGLVIQNSYSTDGSLDKVQGPDGELFHGNEKNGLGQYTNYDVGDGNSITKDYYHGFLTKIDGGSVQDLRMDYDYATGNMRHRWDAIKDHKEVFTYDELNRLTSSTVYDVDQYGELYLSLPQTDYAYDGTIGSTRGNLTIRSDIGQLTYGNHAINAAKNINYPTPPDAPPFVISQETQKITYTAFLKTATISEHVGADDLFLSFEYGPEQQRTRSLLTRNGNQECERVYVGGYEKQTINGTVEEIHYLPGGDGLCAIMVKRNGLWKTYATYTDHLGSIVAVTDIADGSVVAEQNFDPWGRHRKPITWTSDFEPQLPAWLYRGFTGHEHVAAFALINMNGRMYDPNLGRMLSVDNYVNGSSITQSFNRYSYAANNPLRYTDPTGDYVLADDAIAFLIGGVVNLGVGLWNGTIDDFGEGLEAFGAGGAAGTLGLYGPLGWAAGGAIVSAANAHIAGGGSDAILNAGVTGVFTGLVGGAAGQLAVKTLGSVLVNGFNVSSPVVKGLLLGGVGGAGGGYAVGFGMTLANGGNLSEANSAGLSGAVSGFAVGAAVGAGSGYRQALKEKLNPWTGRPTVPARGGVGPVIKGQEGVQQAMQEFEARGGRVLGSEITVEVGGTRIRLDFAGEMHSELHFVEVKNGPQAGLSTNQRVTFPQMMKGDVPVIPYGQNALRAGFKLGVPISTYQLSIVRYWK
jgi:RHS repeat-associated protein